MDEIYHGAAVFRGLSCSRALRAFVSNELGTWIHEHGLDEDGSKIEYRVSFERRGAGHDIFCRTEIRKAGQLHWRSEDFGKSPQESLRRCLKWSRRPWAVVVNAGLVSA